MLSIVPHSRTAHSFGSPFRFCGGIQQSNIPSPIHTWVPQGYSNVVPSSQPPKMPSMFPRRNHFCLYRFKIFYYSAFIPGMSAGPSGRTHTWKNSLLLQPHHFPPHANLNRDRVSSHQSRTPAAAHTLWSIEKHVELFQSHPSRRAGGLA